MHTHTRPCSPPHPHPLRFTGVSDLCDQSSRSVFELARQADPKSKSQKRQRRRRKRRQRRRQRRLQAATQHAPRRPDLPQLDAGSSKSLPVGDTAGTNGSSNAARRSPRKVFSARGTNASFRAMRTVASLQSSRKQSKQKQKQKQQQKQQGQDGATASQPSMDSLVSPVSIASHHTASPRHVAQQQQQQQRQQQQQDGQATAPQHPFATPMDSLVSPVSLASHHTASPRRVRFTTTTADSLEAGTAHSTDAHAMTAEEAAIHNLTILETTDNNEVPTQQLPPLSDTESPSPPPLQPAAPPATTTDPQPLASQLQPSPVLTPRHVEAAAQRVLLPSQPPTTFHSLPQRHDSHPLTSLQSHTGRRNGRIHLQRSVQQLLKASPLAAAYTRATPWRHSKRSHRSAAATRRHPHTNQQHNHQRSHTVAADSTASTHLQPRAPSVVRGLPPPRVSPPATASPRQRRHHPTTPAKEQPKPATPQPRILVPGQVYALLRDQPQQLQLQPSASTQRLHSRATSPAADFGSASRTNSASGGATHEPVAWPHQQRHQATTKQASEHHPQPQPQPHPAALPPTLQPQPNSSSLDLIVGVQCAPTGASATKAIHHKHKPRLQHHHQPQQQQQHLMPDAAIPGLALQHRLTRDVSTTAVRMAAELSLLQATRASAGDIVRSVLQHQKHRRQQRLRRWRRVHSDSDSDSDSSGSDVEVPEGEQVPLVTIYRHLSRAQLDVYAPADATATAAATNTPHYSTLPTPRQHNPLSAMSRGASSVVERGYSLYGSDALPTTRPHSANSLVSEGAWESGSDSDSTVSTLHTSDDDGIDPNPSSPSMRRHSTASTSSQFVAPIATASDDDPRAAAATLAVATKQLGQLRTPRALANVPYRGSAASLHLARATPTHTPAALVAVQAPPPHVLTSSPHRPAARQLHPSPVRSHRRLRPHASHTGTFYSHQRRQLASPLTPSHARSWTLGAAASRSPVPRPSVSPLIAYHPRPDSSSSSVITTPTEVFLSNGPYARMLSTRVLVREPQRVYFPAPSPDVVALK